MVTAEQGDMLRRLNQHVPQFEKFLEERLQKLLEDLPHASMDKVQSFQGHALAYKQLLAELRAYGPNGKSHTAKPNFSTP